MTETNNEGKKMGRQKHPVLGWHTLEDFVRWADVEIGDMVCLDVGLGYGFPIGYLQNYTPESITLTRYRPESRLHPRSLPWNKDDKPITYHVKDMIGFHGLEKLEIKLRR